MTNKNKNIVSTALLATVGLGVCYIVVKYHRVILRKIQLALNFRNPLRNQQIVIVNNPEECRQIIEKIKLHCEEYRVVGFDCEWVTVGGTRRPVALLQIATHKGLCALIRLCTLKQIPTDLKNLLEDFDIVKVGVVPSDDAKYLFNDYGANVVGTLDLRNLAQMAGYKPEGLAKMTKTHLNLEMDKNWRIRCSDWEHQILNNQQINYAAKDAHVAIELFKVFVNKMNSSFNWSGYKNIETILNKCQRDMDVKFNTNICSVNKKKQNTGSVITKPQARFISTRTTPLYDNCFMQAPDGELLCTCDKKKAEWYINKDLAFIVSDTPYTVRLKFEPSGRAVGEVGKFYQQPKINQCVVCGKADSYIRKHVVPREYRKFFPDVMKNHMSHDVLLLCPQCHQYSNISDLKIRHQLAKLCDAPFSHRDGGSKRTELSHLKALKSCARALYYQNHKIPEIRLQELREALLKHYPVGTEITQELLQQASEMDTFEINEGYFVHGKKVVDHYKIEIDSGGIIALERLWRTHFLDTMKPKYLPDLWSVEHNLERLEIRADEGRIAKSDLLLAGIGRPLTASITTNDSPTNNSRKEKLGLPLQTDKARLQRYDSDDTDSLMSQPSSTNATDEEDISFTNDFDL